MMDEASEQQDLASDRFEAMQARVATLERKLREAENLLTAASEFTFFIPGGGWVEFVKRWEEPNGVKWNIKRRTRPAGDDEWMKGSWGTFEEAYAESLAVGWLGLRGGR